MTKKKVINKTTTAQKIVFGAAVVAGALGLYLTPAKSADLLYAPKVPHAGFVDNTGWYLATHAGANFNEDFSGLSFDTGYNVSGAVGYDFGQAGITNVRGEAEIGYLSTEASPVGSFTGSLKGAYGFLNAYADIGEFYGFTPFVGGGVGYADLNAEVQTSGFPVVDASDQTFVWNVTGGLSYALNDRVSLDVAYRYINSPDATFNTVFGTVSDDVVIHQVNAGIRVKL